MMFLRLRLGQEEPVVSSKVPWNPGYGSMVVGKAAGRHAFAECWFVV
jgi:hypothetical protein